MADICPCKDYAASDTPHSAPVNGDCRKRMLYASGDQASAISFTQIRPERNPRYSTAHTSPTSNATNNNGSQMGMRQKLKMRRCSSTCFLLHGLHRSTIPATMPLISVPQFLQGKAVIRERVYAVNLDGSSGIRRRQTRHHRLPLPPDSDGSRA